jgi:hypothetical protein
VLVLQVFTRDDWRWLVVAIGYHLAVDAMAVAGLQSGWPVLVIEATIVPFVLISLAITLGLRPRGEPLVPPDPQPALVPGTSGVSRRASSGRADAAQQLDNSKYA